MSGTEPLADARMLLRQGMLMVLALHNPEGLTAYAFTKGMPKADALAFWNDAKALGFVVLGRNPRGTKLLGLKSEVAE